MSSVTCPGCGTSFGSGKFCPECGTARPEAKAAAPAAAPRSVPGLPPEPAQSGCKGCGKPFMGYFITALGSKYHPECFKCGGCNAVISEPKFAVKDEKPLCMACVEKEQAAMGAARGAPAEALKCAPCGKEIIGRYIKVDNKPMHAECFKCSECSAKLESYVEAGSKYLCPTCADPRRRMVTSGASAAGGYAQDRAGAAAAERAAAAPAAAPAAPAAAPKAASGGGGGAQVTCTRCFTMFAANAAFCPECGKPNNARVGGPAAAAAPAAAPAAAAAPAPAPAPAAAAAPKPAAKKFCGECGAQVSGVFCGECGTAC